jgi:quinolinate synthase
MNHTNLKEELMKLKKERNAVILAHYYQIDEIQEIADFIGDSFELSRQACDVDSDVIVFCGVRFMAESAKILNPGKTVLLPVPEAGCPLADMITGEQVRQMRNKYPDAAVVCYVNSSAEVKAESDICCTSSSAVKVIKSLQNKQIIFLPDQNLGHYASRFIPDKEFILWQGFCIVHHRINMSDMEWARKTHPDAEILVHPECRPEIVDASDFVGSTSQILKHVRESSKYEFVIGTEFGISYKLRQENPGKKFYPLKPDLTCANMKKSTFEDVVKSLKFNRYQIKVDEDIRKRAYRALERMLEVK